MWTIVTYCYIVHTTGNEFWDDTRTLKELACGGYFSSAGADDDGHFDWPKVLEEMLDNSDPVRATVANGYQLAISALGACVWYLRQCCIDHELLSLKNFEVNINSQHVYVKQLHRCCFRSILHLTWLLIVTNHINGALVKEWCWMV